MEGMGGFIAEMKQRMAALEQKAVENDRLASEAHAQRMASLPPGTCERCYGTLQVKFSTYPTPLPCPDCCPTYVYADGVPHEFKSAQLENYREEEGNKTALAKARAFLAGTRDLYLTGTVGAGKTRLACSILNDYVRQRRTGFFVRVPWMLHQLQPGRDGAELEQRMATTSLLVLDDLGAERDQATDYTRRTLLMLYEQRHDRGLRTIFTSNKTVQELSDMQDDERLASRIAGRADTVKLTTADQRLLRRVK